MTLLTLVFAMGMNLAGLAQHCAFCGQKVLVIRVTSSNDTNVISHLKITVLDSAGKTVMTQKRVHDQWLPDTLRFRQNLKTDTRPVTNENDYYFENTMYWFTRDNYYLIFYEMSGSTIMIEDVDGKLNGGIFKTMLVTPSKKDIYPLCSHASNWVDGEKGGFVKGYKPLCVILK